MAASYNVIRNWIRYWEKDLLDKPKELVLGSEYFINILPQAIESLESWQAKNAGLKLQKDSKTWERKLAELLERTVVEDPVVELVAVEYPSEVKELRQLVTANAYDVGRIISLLRTVHEAPSSQTLTKALARELANGEEANREILGAAAMVMARRGIGKLTDRELRELLGRVLAEKGTFILIEGHVGEMKAEEGLEEAARIVARELLVKAAGSTKVSDALDGKAGELFDLFGDDPNGWHFAYGLLDGLRRLWVDTLEAHRSSTAAKACKTSKLVSALLEDDETLTALGTELVRVHASSLFRRAVEVVRLETINEPEPHVATCGRALAMYLGEKGVFHDPEAPGQYEGALYGTTYRALGATASAVQIKTSEELANAYVARDKEFVSGLALDVGRRLTQMLAEEAYAANGAAALAVGGLEDDPEAACLDWSARRAVHAELGRLLAPLGPRLLDHMGDAAHALNGNEFTLGEEFWDSFAKHFSEATKQPMYVPWNIMGENLLGRVVDRLSTCLEGSKTEYLAITRVGDLSPRNLGWRMGSAAFYDAAQFDYGEGRWFREDATLDSRFVHAAVRVSARTRVEAMQHARGMLEDALSCLSFGLSVRTGLSGYRPRVVEGNFVVDLSNGGFRFGGGFVPGIGHTVHYADVSDVPRRAQAYDRLLALSAGGGMLNELQEGFLKAARWFREARWEKDPASRFALYWICLEHIFARGQEGKQKVLYADVPALHITWRNLGQALLPLSWSLREVWRKIKDDDALAALVDADANLKHWRSDERILLNTEKVKLLIDLTPPCKKDAEKTFQGHLDHLMELASQSSGISEYVLRLRERQWFKLYLLYALRNAMFHEAVYDDERLPYLADEIADVADSVLLKVAKEATSPNPECTTVEQLIERFGQQPWYTKPAS